MTPVYLFYFTQAYQKSHCQASAHLCTKQSHGTACSTTHSLGSVQKTNAGRKRERAQSKTSPQTKHTYKQIKHYHREQSGRKRIQSRYIRREENEPATHSQLHQLIKIFFFLFFGSIKNE